MSTETMLDTLMWIGMGLLVYFTISLYSLLRYSLYRDRTKHPREWPRLNRYFEYYNAYPAAILWWIMSAIANFIERLVRQIKCRTSIRLS